MSEINLKSDIVDTLNLNILQKEQSQNLWVINNTARIDNGDRTGHVIFNISTPEGPSVIMIPQTWAPVNLSNQAERSEIIKASGFRRALTRKQVLVVKEEAALRALEDTKTRHEHDIAQYIITNDGRQPGPEVFESRLREDEEEIQENKDFNNVNAKIYEAITREDISEDEQYRSIFSFHKLGLIRSAEREFIIRNSKFNKVKAYVTNKVAE